MVDRDAQKRILEMVEKGRIHSDEALRLLNAVQQDPPVLMMPTRNPIPANPVQIRVKQARPIKKALFWLSAAVTFVSVVVITWVSPLGATNPWFLIGLIIFIFGVVGMALTR